MDYCNSQWIIGNSQSIIGNDSETIPVVGWINVIVQICCSYLHFVNFLS